METKYKPAGDQAILVELGNSINEKVNTIVRSLAYMIENNSELGFGEVILGYTNLLVHYDPYLLGLDQAIDKLKELKASMDDLDFPSQRKIEIPVVYGGNWGPDLEDVAKLNQLTPSEVISIHTSIDYLVYTLGFTPGFAYFGGMPKEIATPRLSSPRVSVPAGSVGIANYQTGIYPMTSPGGWRIIGRTPLQFFDVSKDNPFLLMPGDYVKLVAIEPEEYEELYKKVKNDGNLYTPSISYI